MKKEKISEATSVAAHQLKNPIAVLKNYIEVLIMEEIGKLNRKQKEYLSDIEKILKKMSEIIDYILEVSRIEEGKLKLRKRKFSLEKLVKEAIADYKMWASAANTEIIFEKEKNLPKVFSDPLKIRQVIENFLSNAIKYKNPKKKGKIKLSIKRKGKFLLFSCQDNGIGIPKKDFKKVFTKFYRSERSTVLDPKGIGLGLFINKAIIEESGGKIGFRKNKGSGMTFYFTLPVAK
jgi:signal transduction histidine kinase